MLPDKIAEPSLQGRRLTRNRSGLVVSFLLFWFPNFPWDSWRSSLPLKKTLKENTHQNVPSGGGEGPGALFQKRFSPPIGTRRTRKRVLPPKETESPENRRVINPETETPERVPESELCVPDPMVISHPKMHPTFKPPTVDTKHARARQCNNSRFHRLRARTRRCPISRLVILVK